jgi:hypothetical protein
MKKIVSGCFLSIIGIDVGCQQTQSNFVSGYNRPEMNSLDHQRKQNYVIKLNYYWLKLLQVQLNFICFKKLLLVE